MKKSAQVCLISLPLLVSFSFSQPLYTVGSLEVIDAEGKRVGRVESLGGGGKPRMAFQLNGKLLVLNLSTAGRFQANIDLQFETPDCSGPAFFSDSDRFLPDTSVRGPLQTLYIEDVDATPTNLVGKSRWRDDYDTCSTTEPARVFTSALPALPLINLADEFTPPFKIVVETIISTPVPASAPVGTQIKLLGKGFSVGNAEVMFNGTAGLDVEVINDNALLVTVPTTLLIGPVDITVTTSGGRTTLPGGPGGFTASVFTASIPTLLDWGAGLLMMGLLGAGLHYLRTGRIAE